MHAKTSSAAPEAIQADALIVPISQLEEGQTADPQVDGWSGGVYQTALDSGEVTGKALELLVLHRPAGVAAPRLVLMGLGKPAEQSAAVLRRAAAAATRKLQGKGIESIAFLLPGRFGSEHEAQAIAEGVWTARFEPDVYKTEGRKESSLRELLLLATGDAVELGLARGTAIGDGQNTARKLAVEPGNLLTPAVLVEKARELAADAGLGIEVLDEERLIDEGFGALLGVAQGSVEPPALIVLRYRPKSPARPDVHLGLVGKAVTFDTGGISIKPAAEMDRMKYDMAGGAAVLGAMQAIAALEPPTTVTAFIPTVENMPGAAAQRPGDVVTTLSGKTVEVLNTDAEGRLILCDTLTFALRSGVNRLVDAATLTGSVVVALGHERSGLFCNDDAWSALLLACSEKAGEKFWPMPLDAEYREQLDSPIADLANIGTRWGGSITAAKFLEAFVEEAPWAHLDIAGTAWIDAPKPDMPKGPTGVCVRTFVELALTLSTPAE
ncbi:MAG: leucyl aminopeptidase [Acidobacteria bacterium]|nr:leucyl aminopeptidase [Acidobacteriota bacterium]